VSGSPGPRRFLRARLWLASAMARTFPDPEEQAVVGRSDRLGLGGGD
jgi:hypothetical protein